MFMANNRKKNGAADPGKTASSDASNQRSSGKLAPNPTPESGADWRFTPNMGTCAQINENHYQGGLSGDGPYGTSYESKIPHVGEKPSNTEGNRALKG